MTILNGDSGLSSVGVYKEYTLLEGNEHTFLSTPLDIPTTAPASPQITLTITDTNKPTITPIAPHTIRPIINSGGQNTSSSTATISCEISKNGTAIKTLSLSSCPAGEYWTCSLLTAGDSVVGDVFTIKIWASITGVQLLYQSIINIPDKFDIAKENEVLLDVEIQDASPYIPNYPAINDSRSGWTGSIYIYPSFNTDSLSCPFASLYGDSTLRLTSYSQNPNKKFYGLQLTIDVIRSSASVFPYINSNWYPSKISFRKLRR